MEIWYDPYFDNDVPMFAIRCIACNYQRDIIGIEHLDKARKDLKKHLDDTDHHGSGVIVKLKCIGVM